MRKSPTFHEDSPWIKTDVANNESMCDVTMGSYDGAKICELVGLYMLSKLAEKLGH